MLDVELRQRQQRLRVGALRDLREELVRLALFAGRHQDLGALEAQPRRVGELLLAALEELERLARSSELVQRLAGEEHALAPQLFLVGGEQPLGRLVERLPVAMAPVEPRHLEPDPVGRERRAVRRAQVLGHLGEQRRGLAHAPFLLEQLGELGGDLDAQLLRRHFVQPPQRRDRLVTLRLLGEDERPQILRAQMRRLRLEDGVDQEPRLVEVLDLGGSPVVAGGGAPIELGGEQIVGVGIALLVLGRGAQQLDGAVAIAAVGEDARQGETAFVEAGVAREDLRQQLAGAILFARAHQRLHQHAVNGGMVRVVGARLLEHLDRAARARSRSGRAEPA